MVGTPLEAAFGVLVVLAVGAPLVHAAGREGAGLGLALTAALVRGFGGDISVESDGRSGSRFAEFVCQIVPFYQQFHRDHYGYQDGSIDTHDPSAIAYLIDPTLFRGERWSVVVPTDGPARGATIPDRIGHYWPTPKAHCLLDVDATRFLALYHDRITQS